MSVQVKRRRDTAANIAGFTPAQGELIVDVTNNRMIVGDGSTVGGWPAAKLSEVPNVSRHAVSDTNYTALRTDRLIAYTAITAARTVSLPTAASYPVGTLLIVADETGNCSSSKTITLSANGTDAIDGSSSFVLEAAYAAVAIQSNGAGAWTAVWPLQNLGVALVGVGTAPDPSNALSVYGASALFNGTNFSFTINKSASANTASIIFEDGFSARAQLGLNGSDNFSFKVSPNGTSWTTAIALDATTGAPTFANQRTAVSDVNYSALATDRMIAFTAITAARTVTLPAASAYPAGTRLTVVDESGGCSATITITLNRAGFDLINGATSAVLSMAYGYLAIESNGSNAWTIVDQSTFSMAQQAASAVAITGGALSGVTETLAAGTSSTPPLKLTSGTNTTTAQAGAIEYDGNVFYGSVTASERGVLIAAQIEVLSSSYTLTSTTSAQQLLNTTTNGAITLAAGAYEFECLFSLTSLSSTSGAFGFALGGTATFTQAWQSIASKPASLTGTQSPTLNFNTAASAAVAPANTNTNGIALIKGIVRVTAAGTVIPQVSLGVAAAAVVQAGSYFKIAPIGASGVTSVGNWS
jgi:hypothetical protein